MEGLGLVNEFTFWGFVGIHFLAHIPITIIYATWLKDDSEDAPLFWIAVLANFMSAISLGISFLIILQALMYVWCGVSMVLFALGVYGTFRWLKDGE